MRYKLSYTNAGDPVIIKKDGDHSDPFRSGKPIDIEGIGTYRLKNELIRFNDGTDWTSIWEICIYPELKIRNGYVREGTESMYPNPWESEPGESDSDFAKRIAGEVIDAGSNDDDWTDWIIDIEDDAGKVLARFKFEPEFETRNPIVESIPIC